MAYPGMPGYPPAGSYPIQGGYLPPGGYPGYNPGGYPGGYPGAGGYPPPGGYPGVGPYPGQPVGYAVGQPVGYAAGQPVAVLPGQPVGYTAGQPVAVLPGQPVGYTAGQPVAVLPGGFGEKHLFYIESQMNGKVLDIQGGHAGPGAKVHMWHRHENRHQNQLWYFDQQGIIRSALNDFAMTSFGHGHHVKMEPYNGYESQQWRFSGEKISVPSGECLDIKMKIILDGAEIIAHHYHGHSNQRWSIHYVS